MWASRWSGRPGFTPSFGDNLGHQANGCESHAHVSFANVGHPATNGICVVVEQLLPDEDVRIDQESPSRVTKI